MNSFDQFAQRAFTRLLRSDTTNEETWHPDYSKRLKKQLDLWLQPQENPHLCQELQCFWQGLSPSPVGTIIASECIGALRHLIGPLLEALILSDRLLFLEERLPSETDLQLIQLFSPSISPRRIALCAKRV